MKKLAFPLCSQNLLKIDEYDVHKFTNLKWMVTFCFSQLTGNITVSGNCCVQIYKSYMYEILGFIVDKILVKVLCTNLLTLYIQLHMNM